MKPYISLRILGDEYAECRRQNLHAYISSGRLVPDMKLQVGPEKFIYGFTRENARKFAATLKKERKKRELLRQNGRDGAAVRDGGKTSRRTRQGSRSG